MTLNRRHLLTAAGAVGAWPALAGTPVVSHDAALKTLRVALPAAETGFDPAQINSDYYSASILAHLFEAPLNYDYLARPARLVTATAAALPEASADFKTWTVRLRPGIFFSDDPAFKGQKRELTAHDYVYSIKRFYDPALNSGDLFIYENAKLLGLSELRQEALKNKKPFDYDREVAGCRALDRYTLQIKLGEPDPQFVHRFANPVYMGAMAREVVEHYGRDIPAHPVGTGPFRLASWRRASRIELVRSPSYRTVVYDGTPADDPVAQEIAQRLKGRTLPLVDRVQIDVVEEDQPRWLSFLRGDFDVLPVPSAYATLAAPNRELAPFLAKKGVRMQLQLQPDMAMNYFNMEHPLVGGYTPEKVALRRAIALAYDGDAYRRIVLGGMAIPAQSTIAPFTSGYESDYRSVMSEHSVAKSRALLDLYGYVDRDGDGWRETPDGQPLVLRIAATANQRDRLANEVWKRSLDAVGLQVRFDISTWPDLLKQTRAGSLMIWGFGWNAFTPDGGFFLGIAYGPNGGESNDARFKLAAFDALYDRQRVLPDGPERTALMREAKNLLAAYMPYMVHAHRLVADLLQPWTHGYWRHPFRRDVWQFIDLAR